MRLDRLVVLLGIAPSAGCFVINGEQGPFFAEDTQTSGEELGVEGCEGCECGADDMPCLGELECFEGYCVVAGMTWVPAGPFLRGCDEPPCEEDEGPSSEITLSGFAIDRHEVSVADYQGCVIASESACELPAQAWEWEGSAFNFGAPGREEHPINGLTWAQARSYCERQGKRLPTEAEWEKAARGLEGARYPWGDASPTCARAHLDIGGPGCDTDQTSPVGFLEPGASPFGAIDMAGNVAEWTADYFEPDYYAASPNEDPPGPDSGEQHVVRGGGWLSGPGAARTSARAGMPEGPHVDVGVRCARSPR